MKKLLLVALKLLSAVVFLLACSTLRADSLPSYLVTGGTGECKNPNMLWSLAGSGVEVTVFMEFPSSPCFGIGRAGDQINVNTILGFANPGSAVAGGVTYPSLAFLGQVNINGAPLTIPPLHDPTLVEPVTFSGSLTACTTFQLCFIGPGTKVFNLAFVPTGTVTISLHDIPGGIYFVTSANYQLGEVPEPATLLLFGAGLGLLYARLRSKLWKLAASRQR